MIEFILGRKALYACHRDEALRRLTLVEQGAEQEQTPRGDPHTTRPGREGSAPVSQHIFHCKHGTSASAPISRVVTWKREMPNEIVMTVWPPPLMKIGQRGAYDLCWVEQMAGLGSGAWLVP